MFEVWQGMGDMGDVLSSAQIAAVAAAAGCPSASLPVAVAIAQGESSGNTNAHNPSGEDSRGLWQINLRAHPEYSGANLYDPTTNAQAMMAISGGCQNWQPWGAFTNGSYQRYLPGATAAAGGVDTSGDASGSSGDGSGFDFSSLSPAALAIGLIALLFLMK